MLEGISLPLAFVLLIVYVIYKWLWRPKNFPPGPLGIPIVGSAYKLTSRPELDLMDMANKYGPIMGVKIFDKLTVILSSPESFHQALVKQGTEFSGRPNSIMFQAFTEQLGVAGTDGPQWKVNRKFGHAVFRKLGSTGQVMESWVQEEALSMCHVLQSKKGKAFPLYELIIHSASNIVCRLCFSDRIPFDYEGEFHSGARPLVDWFTKNSHTFVTLVYAPYLRFLPHFANATKDLNAAREKVYEFLRPLIARHKKNFDPNDIRDFADHFIQEMIKHKDDPNTTFTDREFLGYTRDLFFGGTDTTVSSLSWVFVFLVNRPACQKKIQKEIDQIIGPDGRAKWSHYEDMHYTRAFFHEVMRLRTPGPQSLAHRAIIDTTLNGYFIPKDTQVITNFWAVHHDPKLFDQPNVFKPERFLHNGTFKASPYLTPFSLGVRHCFGEPIAKMEMFLYVVTILQRFHLKPPTVNGQLPEDCSRSGLFLTPPKYNIMVRERFSRQRSIMKYKESVLNA